jgi:hypothetical protein
MIKIENFNLIWWNILFEIKNLKKFSLEIKFVSDKKIN